MLLITVAVVVAVVVADIAIVVQSVFFMFKNNLNKQKRTLLNFSIIELKYFSPLGIINLHSFIFLMKFRNKLFHFCCAQSLKLN